VTVTINTAVVAYGEALLNSDCHRVGRVRALGVDEVFDLDGSLKAPT
jgi:hypothetical protein